MKKALSVSFLMVILIFPAFAHSSAPGSGILESGPFTVDGTLTTQDPCIIESGRKILFAATQKIILAPGFKALAGSNFRAMIGEYALLTNQSDDDHDISADWWELVFFGNLAVAGHNDSDGDGVANFVEFSQNTSPNNAEDRPPDGSVFQYDALGRIRQVIRIK